VNANYRRWCSENPARAKSHQLKYKFGITIEDYDRLLKQQDGRCAICRMEPGDKAFDVDHDHAHEQVRGLLCAQCNKALGLFKDDCASLQRAMEYLNA